MKKLRDPIVTWVDQRIEDMLSAPRMWGTDEAIELQMLLLLEIRVLALRPAELIADPRRILDIYATYLTKNYPAKPNRPLSQIVEPDHLGLNLGIELRKFRNQVVKQFVAKKTSIAVQESLTPKPMDAAHATPTMKIPKGPWHDAWMVSQSVHVPPRNRSIAAGGPS